MRAAVLGKPIAHSLSPVLHRAAYRMLGLGWTYDAIECDEPDLPALLERAGPEWAGFSCTMPLKHAALAAAASVGPQALIVGAANTLIRTDSGWAAENTDVDGVLMTLREGDVPSGVPATLLGAGGTAQAVVVALRAHDIDQCRVLVREPSRAAALKRTAARVGVDVTVGRLDPDAPDLSGDLVVSTLPKGAADGLHYPWRATQALLDVVYDPWPTPLAASAAAAGATVLSGALMLLHQAARQVELMTGSLAPVEAMRAALREAAPDSGV